jgi:hypothetical protein
MKNYFILMLSIGLFSNCHALDRVVEQVAKFDGYKAITERTHEMDKGGVVIYKKQQVVYRNSDYGYHFWIGNHFDESLRDQDPHSGKDITGNGVPDLIITHLSGGAHCCNFLSVFELNQKKLQELITIDGGSFGFRVKDFDGDTTHEIEFWDWPIDYLFNSFSESAQGRVVLRIIDGKYRVAKRLMYRRRPDNKSLLKIKSKIRKSFIGMGDRVPYELLSAMMELSYTGYKELAVSIAEDTWPKERSDLKKFKAEFKEALSNSIYWTEFDSGKY